MEKLKTFEEYNNDINIILDQLLSKRVKFLQNFSKKQKLEGFDGLDNIRIENNTILFDNHYGKDIEDCRYDNNYFYITGNEGEEKVKLSDDFMKEIKKQAKNINCGGLK